VAELSLALIVSALLFLTACPFKAGDPAYSAPSEGPDGEAIVHHLGGGSWTPHQKPIKPIKISLPKPPHTSRSDRPPLAGFLEEHYPSGASRRAARW